MRPDAIDWTNAKSELGLTHLPSRRLHRVIWRWFLLIALVQLVVAAAILLLLQGPWRADWRLDHASTIADIAAGELRRSNVRQNRQAIQRTLDGLVSAPNVDFAAVLDADDQVVNVSASDWAKFKRAELERSPGMTYLGEKSNFIPLGGVLTVTTAIDDGAGSGSKLVIGLQDLGAQRAVADGGIALLCGAIIVAVVFLPIAGLRIRRWTQGLGELHKAIRRLESGATPRPATIGGSHEISYLLLAFNNMAGKLIAGRRELLEANEDLERRVASRTIELDAANDLLEKKNEELAELTDRALRFTDDVAHEFRTPLAVVMEFASITAEGIGGEVTEKQREFLDFIVNASNELAQLVDDFLDSGKLRARSLRVDRQTHDVDTIIESTWPMLETRASSRGIHLQRDVESDLPPVYVDIEKVRRAIVNLVMNAVKFSRAEGTVTVSAHALDRGGARISISDHGPGLSPEAVKDLFERFKQTDAGRRSSAKGFGLGLNIVRDLVTLNLGVVDVQSKVGEGSTFSFTVPPADSRAICEWYIARVAERSPCAKVSALRITCTGPDLSELQESIASSTHSNDIQLIDDDCRAIIVIGEASNPEGWRARLMQQDLLGPSEDGVSADSRLDVSVIGTWTIEEALEPLSEALGSSVRGEACSCV